MRLVADDFTCEGCVAGICPGHLDVWENQDEQVKGLVQEGNLHPRRASHSGNVSFQWDCRPCGHKVRDHDDNGCRWILCDCHLPGERK